MFHISLLSESWKVSMWSWHGWKITWLTALNMLWGMVHPLSHLQLFLVFFKVLFWIHCYSLFTYDLMEQELMAGSTLQAYADDILLYHTINSTHDFMLLQSDINKVTLWSWSCANFLTFNSNKCKFMVPSWWWSSSCPVTPLTIENHPLEQVLSFKYLGIHLSCDLSYSMHIHTITCRARKVLGLLYRKFYNLSPPDVLLCLYLSLVKPHLEYATVVWSSYLKKDILQQEHVQTFCLHVATKLWNYPYHYVPYRSQLNSLENHRTVARLWYYSVQTLSSTQQCRMYCESEVKS